MKGTASTFTIKMLPIPLNFRGPGAIFKKNATVLFSVDGEKGGAGAGHRGIDGAAVV